MPADAAPDPAEQLVELYPVAVREVYGYLRSRTGGDERLAEDLTADAFMAAVDAIRRDAADEVTTGWLVTVARRRLVDHWRRQATEERKLRVVGVSDVPVDPWEGEIDVVAAHAALAKLAPDHRTALTLRYLDGLPALDVAALMGRSPGATDSLLQRARAALRDVYLGGSDD